MKKMSKLLSGAMALALVACMGTTAFAAEGPQAGNGSITELDGSKEITVQLNADITETSPTYSVNVAWTSMQFTYTGTEDSEWNPTTHTYDTDGTGSWDISSATVTVVNHSDVAVGLTGEYDAGGSGYDSGAEKDGVTVTYTNFSADQLDAGDADNTGNGVLGDNMATATVAVAGVPTGDLSGVTAGTITVTISTATH